MRMMSYQKLNVAALSWQAEYSATDVEARSALGRKKKQNMFLRLSYFCSATISSLYMDTLSKPQRSFVHLKIEHLIYCLALW